MLPITNRQDQMGIAERLRLFTGSARGGRVASELYSLMNTCRALGVNAERYLTDVLDRLSTTKSSDIAALTPWAWLAAQSSSS